jgi:hypothetical protein
MIFMLGIGIVQAQFKFTTSNGSATITGYTGSNTTVVVPSTIDGYPVVAIGDLAFAYLSLVDVTLPDSVASIGNNSFAGCLNLTNISLGNGIRTIGDFAFNNCLSLTNVMLPASVLALRDETFANCVSLTGVYFYGNAPSALSTTFLYDALTVYYLPGTSGWGATFAGQPTAPWTLPYPLILAANPNFGVHNDQFSFEISWATNLTVVVEASTNLAGSSWQALETNSLVNGTNYFKDADWTNFPSRFYRVRLP